MPALEDVAEQIVATYPARVAAAGTGLGMTGIVSDVLPAQALDLFPFFFRPGGGYEVVEDEAAIVKLADVDSVAEEC